MIKLKTIYPLAIVGFALSVSSALAWNNPTATPPNGSGAITVISGAPTSTLYIASGGNIGFGTTSPATILQLNGSGTAAVPATTGTTQSTGHRLRLSTTSGTGILDMGTAGSSGMWLQSTDSANLATNYALLLNPNGGNVGIGKTSPATALDVAGTVTATSFSGSMTSSVSAANITAGTFGSAGVGGNYNFPANLGVGTGGTGVLTVTGGDVVINTTAAQGYPDLTFQSDVTGVTLKNDGARLWAAATSGTAMKFNIADSYSNDRGVSLYYIPGTTGAGAGELRVGQLDKNSATYTHGITTLYTNGLERVRINSSGNVGVGTTNPGQKLDVVGGTESIYARNSAAGGYTLVGYNDASSYGRIGAYNAGWKPLLINEGGGNVGIGTTSPSEALHVNGTILGGGTATNGSLILAGQYSGANNYLNTFGGYYSSGGTVIGYGVKPLTGSAGYASSTSINTGRAAINMDGGAITLLTAATQTVTPGTAVSMTPVVTVANNGLVTFSGNTNLCHLITFTSGSGTVSCPAGYYTWSGVAQTSGQMLCCKVDNPI